MARVNVYVPDELYDAAMDADLTFSTAAQLGLRAQLAVEGDPGESAARRMFRGLKVLLGVD